MKFLVWSTVLCVVSFTLSGVFYGYSDFTGLEKKIEGKYKFNYSSSDSDKDFGERVETFKASEINKIDLKSSISEVTVKSDDVDKIKLKVQFLNENVEETYKTSLVDGVLKIDTGEDSENQSFSSFFGNKKNGCKISLVIPDNLVLDYDFKLALGSLDMKDLKVGDFKAKLAAGNIEVEDVEFGSAYIKAAAGNIELENIKISKEMEINAAAGNVEIELAQASPNLKIKSAAGNIEIAFARGVEPDLTFESLSTVGELSVRRGFKSQEGSTYVYGEGKGRLEVKSTFGNVDFK